MCAGLWVPCLIFSVCLGPALGPNLVRNRKFLAGSLKVVGAFSVQPRRVAFDPYIPQTHARSVKHGLPVLKSSSGFRQSAHAVRALIQKSLRSGQGPSVSFSFRGFWSMSLGSGRVSYPLALF